MNQLGLIGYPLGHSRSPEIFSDLFSVRGSSDWRYDLFPIHPDSDIRNELKSIQDLRGFNVTVPYKEKIIPFLDSISEEAKAIGAVNTVVVHGNNWTGYNTDHFGFAGSLAEYNISPINTLILGSGGASKAVQSVLAENGTPFSVVSRHGQNGDLSYEDLTSEGIRSFDLIVNTTPLGMSPNADTYPEIPYSELTSEQTLYDLVYNPSETTFMSKGKEMGCRVFNGERMLQLQAEKAWEFFQTSLRGQ